MSDSDDDDALIESLEHEAEHDPSLAHLREARVQALASDLARSKALRSEGFGTYDSITDEKSLMDTATSAKRCIVHFYKSDFNRCRIMDGHLESLSSVHLEARFIRINVEHAPFLVTKLNVRVLPCVIGFLDGVSADRIIGFEGVGYSEDTFKTDDLENRFLEAGVLEAQKIHGNEMPLGKKPQGRIRGNEASEDTDEDCD